MISISGSEQIILLKSDVQVLKDDIFEKNVTNFLKAFERVKCFAPHSCPTLGQDASSFQIVRKNCKPSLVSKIRMAKEIIEI